MTNPSGRAAKLAEDLTSAQAEVLLLLFQNKNDFLSSQLLKPLLNKTPSFALTLYFVSLPDFDEKGDNHSETENELENSAAEKTEERPRTSTKRNFHIFFRHE